MSIRELVQELQERVRAGSNAALRGSKVKVKARSGGSFRSFGQEFARLGGGVTPIRVKRGGRATSYRPNQPSFTSSALTAEMEKLYGMKLPKSWKILMKQAEQLAKKHQKGQKDAAKKFTAVVAKLQSLERGFLKAQKAKGLVDRS